MRNPRTRQKEDAKQDEGKIPRMIRVRGGRKRGGDEASRSQRVLLPGPVDERERRWDGYDGLHGKDNAVQTAQLANIGLSEALLKVELP